MAYGRSKGARMGGKGGHGFSLKSDMTNAGKSGTKHAFGKAAGKGGVKGSMTGKGKAGKQARAKV